MSMTIVSQMSSVGDDTYYEEAFLTMIDSYMTYLKNLATSNFVTLDAQLVYKHEGDLFGLLDEMSYLKKHHYAIMRINGFRSSNDLTLDQVTLFIPDLNEVDLLNQIYRTKKFTL